MSSRMDKYNEPNEVPTRSSKNQSLYKQIYNAYDEFENLVIPSNSKEIDLSKLKSEVTSRDEYKEIKEYGDITNNKIIRKEKVLEEQKKENEIYDINELLSRAVSSNKKTDSVEPIMENTDYLKRLKLDNRKTNIEQVKELYDDIKEESNEEDESLLKTANLSLEILSDLKGDNDMTLINPPIKEEELPNDGKVDKQFYSNTYKFSKKDFEDKKYEANITSDESEETKEKGTKVFFKIFLLVLGIAIVFSIAIYIFSYFNRV